MIWRLRSDEPSFSSINEKSFESRRVRTQPWTWIESIGAALCNASLIAVGESWAILRASNVQRSTPNVQPSTFKSRLAFWSARTCPRFQSDDMSPHSKIQLNGSQLPGCGGGLVPLRVRYVYSCNSRS